MTAKIDLIKLCKYLLRRGWILLICAIIGFGGMYYRAVYMQPDLYTAEASMYVYNANPNVVNYQYTNTSDLNTAIMLIDTYKEVVRSKKVLNAVAERLGNSITADYISRTLSFDSVNDTGIMTIYCTTSDPQLSMDICNAVADIAPDEIIRVVSAGSVEVIDYAELPFAPNDKGGLRKGAIGALAGIVLAAGVLLVIFLLNDKLTDSKELTENYTIPLLSVIGRMPEQLVEGDYLINSESDLQRLSEYTKLRMNLRFAMIGMKTVLVSSAIPGECKSTVSSNLAVACSMKGNRILLIDGDMRKPSQYRIFDLQKKLPGLSDVLTGEVGLEKAIVRNVRENLDIIPTGTLPPNPAELIDSKQMRALLEKLEKEYEYTTIIVDLPPINVVSDALALSDINAGMLLVTRCGYSRHKEIRKALIAAEFAKTKILGVVMTCATRQSDDSYSGYYSYYYSAYDHRRKK